MNCVRSSIGVTTHQFFRRRPRESDETQARIGDFASGRVTGLRRASARSAIRPLAACLERTAPFSASNLGSSSTFNHDVIYVPAIREYYRSGAPKSYPAKSVMRYRAQDAAGTSRSLTTFLFSCGGLRNLSNEHGIGLHRQSIRYPGHRLVHVRQ